LPLIRLPALLTAFQWRLAERRKLIFALLLALAGLLVGSSLLTRRLEPGDPPPPAPLTSSPKGISAIGRVEPKGEIIKVSAPALMEGAKVETLLVSQGEQVKAGQVIAILDNHERLKRSLELAHQQWNVAKVKLKQVEAGAKTGEILSQTSRVAQLQRELEGQIASQAFSIKRLEYEMRNAETECRRYSRLLNAGAVSASQRDNICLLADTTQQQRLEAEAHLQRTRQTLTQQINEARSSRAAIAEVRPIDVEVAGAVVEEAHASVKQAEANFALSFVRSPRSGQILRVITKGGEKVGNEGIVELGNTKQMTVVAEVYETDIHRVKVGQRASIISQGLGGALEGVVAEVGLRIGKKDLLGTDPAAASDARVVEVKINLSPQSSQLAKSLTNLQVDIVIHVPESRSTNDKHGANASR
jgi:HlyD family secretion protein